LTQKSHYETPNTGSRAASSPTPSPGPAPSSRPRSATRLAATQGYKAVTGSISFSPGSRVPDKTVSIIGVKDDRLNLSAEVTPSWIAKPLALARRGRLGLPGLPSM